MRASMFSLLVLAAVAITSSTTVCVNVLMAACVDWNSGTAACSKTKNQSCPTGCGSACKEEKTYSGITVWTYVTNGTATPPGVPKETNCHTSKTCTSVDFPDQVCGTNKACTEDGVPFPDDKCQICLLGGTPTPHDSGKL